MDLRFSAANVILGFLVCESWHVIELVTLSALDCVSVKEKREGSSHYAAAITAIYCTSESKALQRCNSFSSGRRTNLIRLSQGKLLLAKISCQFLPLGDKKSLSCLNPLPQSIIWSLRSSHDIWHRAEKQWSQGLNGIARVCKSKWELGEQVNEGEQCQSVMFSFCCSISSVLAPFCKGHDTLLFGVGSDL